jgi:hypothetical protein
MASLTGDRRIHPYIWSFVRKMYDYCYDSDDKVTVALKSLGLETKIDQIHKDNLVDFLMNLSLNDAFKVLKDIPEIPDFWPDRNDLANERNYTNSLKDSLRFGYSIFTRDPDKPLIESQKLWGSQLVNLLEQKNGISYDKVANQLSYVGTSEVVILPSTSKRHQDLIGSISNDKIANDPFYRKLVKEINIAYASGLYTSCIVLSRKLLENLMIDLLKSKYPINSSGNLDLYYIQDEGRHRDFSFLIEVLNTKKNEFMPEDRTVSQLISKITPLRENANAVAHTLSIIPDAQELLRYDIQYILDLLFRLMS